MINYVDHVLQPGEQARYLVTIQWITCTPGLLILIVSLALLIVAGSGA